MTLNIRGKDLSLWYNRRLSDDLVRVEVGDIAGASIGIKGVKAAGVVDALGVAVEIHHAHGLERLRGVASICVVGGHDRLIRQDDPLAVNVSTKARDMVWGLAERYEAYRLLTAAKTNVSDSP